MSNPDLMLAFGAGGVATALLAAISMVRGGLKSFRWEAYVGAFGLGMVLMGQYMGLFVAPRERMMGEVGRILYVHVPSAWLTMLIFTFTCIFAFAFLMSGKRIFDSLVESSIEVGVIMAILLQVTGSLFAKPTWGVYWDWDPRLVSTAVMTLSFVGVLILRSVLDDPDRRATWTSVGAILATLSMLITYFSVRLWRTLHQMQSSPDSVSDPMVVILRANAFAFLFLSIFFIAWRTRIAVARAQADEAPPLPPEVPV